MPFPDLGYGGSRAARAASPAPCAIFCRAHYALWDCDWAVDSWTSEYAPVLRAQPCFVTRCRGHLLSKRLRLMRSVEAAVDVLLAQNIAPSLGHLEAMLLLDPSRFIRNLTWFSFRSLVEFRRPLHISALRSVLLCVTQCSSTATQSEHHRLALFSLYLSPGPPLSWPSIHMSPSSLLAPAISLLLPPSCSIRRSAKMGSRLPPSICARCTSQVYSAI